MTRIRHRCQVDICRVTSALPSKGTSGRDRWSLATSRPLRTRKLTLVLSTLADAPVIRNDQVGEICINTANRQTGQLSGAFIPPSRTTVRLRGMASSSAYDVTGVAL